jgi:chromosomal replication initiator protein
VDALLIDDIDHFAGTERTQDEFFHLFNALTEAGKQIVLTAAVAPRAMREMDERLRSRLEGGLVVEIQAPDRSLREKLIARQLSLVGIEPERGVLQSAATLDAPTVRDVLKLAQRLGEIAARAGGELTSDDVSRATTVRSPTPSHRPTPAHGASFGDAEKTVWEWPDLSGRIIEDLR